MKSVSDLVKVINGSEFSYNSEQFKKKGKKNILFVSPNLSGRSLYRYIFPYFSMFDNNAVISLTSINKYNFDENIEPNMMVLFEKQVKWADYVVFPFVLKPLGEEVYQGIRDIKPSVKIAYSVDFNYYELSKMHPYYKTFSKDVIAMVEDNIFYSDLCIINNTELQGYLLNVFNGLLGTKYKGMETNLKLQAIQFVFDTDIALANVDYEPEQSVKRERSIKKKRVVTINKSVSADKKKKDSKVDDKKTENKVKKVKKTKNGKTVGTKSRAKKSTTKRSKGTAKTKTTKTAKSKTTKSKK